MLLLIFLFGTVLAVDAAGRARDSRRELLLARDELTDAREVITPLARFDFTQWPTAEDSARARAQLQAATQHLDAARDRLGWTTTVAPALGWLPGWGEEIAASGDLLEVADVITAEAAGLLEAAAPIFEGDEPIVEVARTVFVERAGRLDASLARLEATIPEVERLDGITWGGPFAAAENLLADLRDDLAEVPQGRTALAALAGGFDALFGFDGPTTFLVLGQNDHEIRPTGGFIGTIGQIEVASGEIVSSDYRSSYEYSPDGPQTRRPPWQMIDFFGLGEWHARDGNLSPDFPTSADQVLRMVEEDRGVSARHVLAIDTTMVGLLLEALGPVETPEFSVPLSAENWFLEVEEVLFEASFDVGRHVARSAYLGPVVRELLLRAEQAEREQLPQLITALRDGTEGRHLQIYSREEEVQRIADRFDASGRLRAPRSGDFVALIDANFSYSKVQPAITRDVVYVQRDGLVDLVITWTNDPESVAGDRYARFGRDGAIWDRYQQELRVAPGVFGNFVQLYLRPDAEIVTIRGFDYAPSTNIVDGLTEVAGFLEVGVGQRRTVVITYRPPDEATDGVSFWKQGGQSHGTLQVLRMDGNEQVTLYLGSLDRDLAVLLHEPDVAAADAPSARSTSPAVAVGDARVATP